MIIRTNSREALLLRWEEQDRREELAEIEAFPLLEWLFVGMTADRPFARTDARRHRARQNPYSRFRIPRGR